MKTTVNCPCCVGAGRMVRLPNRPWVAIAPDVAVNVYGNVEIELCVRCGGDGQVPPLDIPTLDWGSQDTSSEIL